MVFNREMAGLARGAVSMENMISTAAFLGKFAASTRILDIRPTLAGGFDGTLALGGVRGVTVEFCWVAGDGTD